MLEQLNIEQWLELNAKLQQKKNALRNTLKEMGVMAKDKTNGFDKYSYFSEAGYKKLFTELFAKHGLELTSDEIEYETFETTSEKMPNGRKVKFEFKLSDVETGFYEVSHISGEAMDKGDKAGYKADTGAIKYYLANTFMVATGDDPENESPEAKTKTNKAPVKATPKQIEMIENLYDDENIEKMLNFYKAPALEELTVQQASQAIAKKKGNNNGN